LRPRKWNSYTQDTLFAGARDDGSLALGAERIRGVPRNTHGEAGEGRDAWVLIVGGEERVGRVAGRVDRVGIIDPDDGAVGNLHAPIVVDLRDEPLIGLGEELRDVDLASDGTSTIQDVSHNLVNSQ